jgi:hypothetical protein
MAAVDNSTVYRDATYSARTQERLRQLLGRLTSVSGWNEGDRGEEVQALTDVVQRWDANDATETIFNDEPPAIVSPLLSPDPTFVDSSIKVYKAACPECGRALEWAIETPPIPRTLYSWFDPNGEGQRIIDCPGCGTDLPEGNLTKLEAQP